MRTRSGPAILGRMIKLVAPMTGWMILAVLTGSLGHLCAIAVTVLGVLAALTAAGLVGALALKTVLIVLFVAAVLRGVMAYAEQNCNHYIAFKLLALIRDRVFAALRRLCPAKLEGKERGNLITMITTDIELLETFYAHTISPICIGTLVSLTMAVCLWLLHPVFGLTALAAYAMVGLVIPLLTTGRSAEQGAEQRRCQGALSSYYLDSLRGLTDIQQMDAGQARLAGVEAHSETLELWQKRISRHKAGVAGAAAVCVLLFPAIVLFEGARLQAGGAVTAADTILAVTALMSSFGPTLALSSLFSGISRMLSAGDRVMDILDEQPETADIQDGAQPDFTGAEVAHLSFSYGQEEILHDLSIPFPQGQIIGVRGRSGSGKSTLLKLLMRFWRAPQDTVRVSGLDVDRIQTAHLRRLEGYMTQSTDLFHTTIAENLRIGKAQATDDEIVAAAKKASVHDFILTLPQGYETQVGELGDTLSGGERQRIGLARAFLHDAPLLLLDEPTSSLDSLNEGIILKALREEGAARTVVLVSHRKSTMGVADAVYTVENGRMC